MKSEATVLYGVFFAVLPAKSHISPLDLKETCESIATNFTFELKWTHYREPLLLHPQLPTPLKFLEISGKLSRPTAEKRSPEELCQEILESLNSNESIVGNSELLLILPNSPIPLLDLKMPEDESIDTFDEYGIMVMRNAVGEIAPLYDHALSTFERLYAAMQAKPKKHYKEIMQRDGNRFDFRLDLEANGVWKQFEKGARWKKMVEKIFPRGHSLVKCGCVLSLPGASTQYYHSDGVHVGESASFASDKARSTHALCVFVPLIDLNESVGYTEFWAGSHKYSNLLQKKGVHAVPGGHDGIIKTGDCLLYDCRVVHRGMPNNSKEERPICYFLYSECGMEHVEDQNFVEDSVFD